MINIYSKIVAIEKVLTKKRNDDYKDAVIIAYKRGGVNYYVDSNGVERRVDSLENLKNRVVILPILNGFGLSNDYHADEIINYNEYPHN